MSGAARHASLSQRFGCFALAAALGSLPYRTSLAQGLPEFRISGIVVSERNGAPVAHCHLAASLRSQNSGLRTSQRRRDPPVNESLEADTDSTGHFTLAVPSAGAWQIYASGRGYRQQPFDGHENFFSSVVLTTTSPVHEITFHLEPDSSISGFVRDEAGEAVRDAHVTLFAADTLNPGVIAGNGAVRANAVADDRGHYEFAALVSGNYNVAVQAEPWYATASQGRRLANTGSSVDPVLDVVYPQTWFPGVSDRRSTEILSLHNGEDRQADFSLTPIPATHLHLVPASPAGGPNSRGQLFPQLERVSTDGNPFYNSPMRIDPQGQIDIGGLSPGLYRVTPQGAAGPQGVQFVRVPAGSQRNLDLAAAALPGAEVSFHFDGDTGRSDVVLTDVETGGTFISSGRNLQRRRGPEPAEPSNLDRKLDVPPGRYQVVLRGDSDVYLSAISVKGTPVANRIVDLASGSTALTLELNHGRAAVHGLTTFGSQPLAGAMVMLVPATFGQPGSITLLSRDQTNTDGSFSVEGVIPGDYILLAIDHGWSLNWRDPSTLRPYLLHGTPVSLSSNANLKLDIVAQAP